MMNCREPLTKITLKQCEMNANRAEQIRKMYNSSRLKCQGKLSAAVSFEHRKRIHHRFTSKKAATKIRAFHLYSN